MPDTVKIILELSPSAQTLLEQQDVDLYYDLQRELPTLNLVRQQDPNSLAGSRDVTTVILAISTLVSALAPVVINIFKQFTPPNRSTQWKTEETETRRSDGTIEVHRIYVRSADEERPWVTADHPKENLPLQAEKTRADKNG